MFLTAKCKWSISLVEKTGHKREESVIIPLGRKRKSACKRNFTRGRENRVSRNACEVRKQGSDTVAAYIHRRRMFSLFLPPPFSSVFYDFRSLFAVENGHNGLPSCWHISREGGRNSGRERYTGVLQSLSAMANE